MADARSPEAQETAPMPPQTPPCDYVDVALSMQQLIRDREPSGPTGAAVVIGDPCGEPSVGSVGTDDGGRDHFCARHVRYERVVRD
jgi:hypothetical protein